jgi:outer membrane protein assembly factor BamB
MRRNLTILLCLALLSLTAGAREPWGNDPTHNMVLEAKNLPTEFNEETLIWEIKTGAKHQFPMPTIVGDKILVGSDAKGNPEPFWSEAADHGAAFTCYSLQDGKEIWRLIVPQGGYGPGTYGVCGTPVVKGDRVYIMAMWEIFCLDLNGLADGNDGMTDELEIMTRPPFEVPQGQEMPEELPAWAADVIWHFSLKPYDISVQDATSCSVIEIDGQLWVSTANEIGHRARSYDSQKDPPHMVVLDTETGKLLARDRMTVPIVFHGEWSSPSLLEIDGEKAVIFPDGYGVLHALAVPEPSQDGQPVTLQEYWSFDLNPTEWRYRPDGREIVYTVDKRLAYKYPQGYYSQTDKYYMYTEGNTPAKDEDHWTGFDPSIKRLADGRDPTVQGPCEIISMPAIHQGRIYIGLGRDRAYGLAHATGRFVCLQLDNVRQKPKVLWEDRQIGRTQSTASVADGLVYIADGKGNLNCYDAQTGKVHYRYPLGKRGIKERSQMLVDGKIYCCNARREMKVLQAGPEPKLLAESRLPGAAATIEAVDGKILIATERELLLYGQKTRAEKPKD